MVIQTVEERKFGSGKIRSKWVLSYAVKDMLVFPRHLPSPSFKEEKISDFSHSTDKGGKKGIHDEYLIFIDE
jgi:hypothetical protein